MKAEQKSINQLFRNYIVVTVICIFIIISSLFILLWIGFTTNNDIGMLINVLGKQRMLTQIMTREANRIYVISSEISDSRDKNNIRKLNQDLINSRANLKQSMEEWQSRYDTISSGYVITDGKKIRFSSSLEVLKPYIEEKKNIWPVFKSSLEILIDEKQNIPCSIKALEYINDNNEKLLKNSDMVTYIVVEAFKKNNTFRMGLSAAIFIFGLILLSLLFIKTYRDLLLPIKQMYQDMAQAGITNLNLFTPQTNKKQLVPIFSEVREIFNKFNYLILLIENLNKNTSFKETLSYIYNTFSDFIPYTYIGLALIDDEDKTVRAAYGVDGKHHKGLARELSGYKISIKETSLENIIKSGNVRIINDLEEYLEGKPLKEYNYILLKHGIRSSITFPLKDNNMPVGIIFFSSDKKNSYTRNHIEFLKTLANSIMISLEKNILHEDMIISSIQALANLAEHRDPETGEHIQRMKTYSKAIAELLSKEERFKNIIDIEYINNIEKFSPLHDIGKVGIQDSILLKPGKLNEEEFEIMKTHTIYGARVLKEAERNIQKRGRSIFKMGIEIAEGHHEKWDGSGYPYGKSGEEIPLSARIVAVADVFDALTGKRPYKEPFTVDDSYKIIIEGSGRHFDPDIIKVFIENKDKIVKIYNGFKRKGML